MLERALGQTTRKMGQHTFAILMPAHLQCFLITVKIVALEKVSFSDTQNHKAVS